MAVYQLPGSNAVEVSRLVQKRMAELAKKFPSDMRYNIPLDTTKAVTAGIHEIVVTLFIALALVIFVVYIFLQSWRATIIPLMAVPVSLIGTFIIFPALGFSINTLSLFGLVLAIGLVVDDAIIVVEAVEHLIDTGLDPRDATITAMKRSAVPSSPSPSSSPPSSFPLRPSPASPAASISSSPSPSRSLFSSRPSTR